MSNTIYCAAAGCGGMASYITTKPSHCPKCGKPYTAAFVAASVAPTPVASPQKATPRKPTSLVKRPSASRRSDRPAQSWEAGVMKPVNASAQPPLPAIDSAFSEEADSDHYVTDEVSEDQVQAMADALKEELGIDEATVRASFGGDTVVRFGDLCREAERTQGPQS